MKPLSELIQQLEEKLVIVGGGKRFGQVIFLAGGAGSGKGFAIDKLISSSDYKVFDPDAVKDSYLKYNRLTGVYPELNNINLKNPRDVSFLHKWIQDKGFDNKGISQFLSVARSKDLLPNIIFDKTMKDNGDLETLVPMLEKAGYKKENMHLIWVLTDFRIAVRQNFERRRTVPINILIKTHAGAMENMYDNLIKTYPYRFINGDAYVILGGSSNTIVFEPSKKSSDGISGTTAKSVIPNLIIKSFKYLKVKEAGKPVDHDRSIEKKIRAWIYQNAPSKSAIADFLDDEEEKDEAGPTPSRTQTFKRQNITYNPNF